MRGDLLPQGAGEQRSGGSARGAGVACRAGEALARATPGVVDRGGRIG
ncbi:MAG: hypothetical protein JSV36_06950 [Anaerolineae bacterium]|nr:MAG: hypothetical protein JSV36_06950 [Anaerolineae bacterium]